MLQLYCRFQLQLKFNPWPRNFHVPGHKIKRTNKQKKLKKKPTDELPLKKAHGKHGIGDGIFGGWGGGDTEEEKR